MVYACAHIKGAKTWVFFIIMHLKAVLKRKWNAEIIKKFEERCIIKHKLKLKFMEFFITK